MVKHGWRYCLRMMDHLIDAVAIECCNHTVFNGKALFIGIMHNLADSLFRQRWVKVMDMIYGPDKMTKIRIAFSVQFQAVFARVMAESIKTSSWK